MRICTILLLLLSVVCTYARSFNNYVDIPDPPHSIKDNKSKGHAVKETIDEKSKKSLNSTTQHPTITKAPTQNPSNSSTPTTLDPWDEFCKEACEEGLAGPECDCPEHPIGRRSVVKSRHRRSTIIDTEGANGSESLKHDYTSKAKPTVNLKLKRFLMKYCKELCDHGIDNGICKCSGGAELIKPGVINQDPANNINGTAIDEGQNVTATPGAVEPTKDPALQAFCEMACAEGQGTLACNCHDHIVGRRRRSANAFTGYHTKGFLKRLESNRLQHIQRRSGQDQDITHLENTLHRVNLHRDSMQPQDFSVHLPLRTLPEIAKAHKEKVRKNEFS